MALSEIDLEAGIAPPLRELENGAIRIEGTRVSLDSVVHHFNQGRTPEDIVRSFPTLNLRDVYAVIAYYLGHRSVVDAYIERQEVKAEELRREIEANQPSNTEFRARLEARRRENEAKNDALPGR